MRKVVITGMGIVSPVGTGVEYAWKNVVAGNSGIRKIDTFDVSALATQIGGIPVCGTEPGQYNPEAVLDPREMRKMDKSIMYGVVAADEALRDAGLIDYDGDKERIGLYNGGPRRISPFFTPKSIINMTAGHISIKYGLKGPNLAVVTACATGAHSIGEAARLIEHGDADIMVAGGTEGAIDVIGIAGFNAMKALSTRNDNPTAASRPWDKDRDGFIMSEGAGILILEEYEHAVARGAKIYAEVAGYGLSGDAYHITAPAEGGEGGLRAMRAALHDAGLQPSDVDYVNAHGTSTGLGDMGELAAVQKLFGDLPVSMSSTKSVTGHLLGAAGAVEAICCTLAIRDGVVPPTINLEHPEEAVGNFDLVPNVAKKRKVDVAISNSFGFGGTNASLVLKRC